MRTDTYEIAGISARAVAGTYTVLFAFDASKTARKGLLGFALHRRLASQTQGVWLKGLKVFKDIVKKPKKGERYDTRLHPIQSFLWGDYTAKPGVSYVYTVRPVYGAPDDLKYGPDVIVKLTTEREEAGPGDQHGVWFNRGAIASQFFAETFQNAAPSDQDDPKDPETAWLSRGLLEACLKFIDDTPKGDALRVAAYEFTYPPILNALKRAIDRKVDVKIVYEAGKETVKGERVDTGATSSARKAILKAKIPKDNLIKRTKRKDIPHNKFMVRLENKTDPTQVWTGSTNFTPSGFLGQTNVGHWIVDGDVSEQYLKYWKELAKDPEPAALEAALDELTPEPEDVLADDSVTCVFSPRKTKAMLAWYAKRIEDATETVMFTGGFGVSDTLAPAFAKERDYLRFIMLEKPATKKSKALLGNDRDLIVVYGNVLGEAYGANKKGELTIRRAIPGFELAKWFYQEELFRKQGNIFFIHTKILLVDPLSDNPLVFSGSANFSDNSLRNNDENMLLISGNKRVADIYMTEYDRILRHFYFRDVAAETHDKGDSGKAVFLEADSATWTAPYFTDGNFKDRRRKLFFP